jgi:hypothetical protein
LEIFICKSIEDARYRKLKLTYSAECILYHIPNTAIIQRFQNEVLRNIADEPWYVRNAELHRELKMDIVTAEIRRYARKHEDRLIHHENVEAIQLLENGELLRRLRRRKPFELVS